MSPDEANRIILAACAEYGITMADLLSSRKQGRVTQAREICCYLVEGLSDDDVAKLVQVHRTTVGKARKRVAERLKKSTSLRNQVKRIRNGAEQGRQETARA